MPEEKRLAVVELSPRKDRLVPWWARISFAILVGAVLSAWILCPELVLFWWNCMRIGWAFGNGVSGFLQAALMIGTTLTVLLRKYRKEGPWDSHAVQLIGLFFLASFALTTVFIAPFLEFKRVSGESRNEAAIPKNPRLLSENQTKALVASLHDA